MCLLCFSYCDFITIIARITTTNQIVSRISMALEYKEKDLSLRFGSNSKMIGEIMEGFCSNLNLIRKYYEKLKTKTRFKNHRTYR